MLSHHVILPGPLGLLSRWLCTTLPGRLLFNMLSRFVIAFLPKSKDLLILWQPSSLQSAVILEPKKIKSVTASTFSPSIYHEMMGPDAVILDFYVELQVRFFTLFFHPPQETL